MEILWTKVGILRTEGNFPDDGERNSGDGKIVGTTEIPTESILVCALCMFAITRKERGLLPSPSGRRWLAESKPDEGLQK